MKNNIISSVEEGVRKSLGGKLCDNKKMLILSFSLTALSVYLVSSISYRRGYDMGHAEGHSRGVDEIIEMIREERENTFLGIS